MKKTRLASNWVCLIFEGYKGFTWSWRPSLLLRLFFFKTTCRD
ncbi:unnamed protein product [Musa hybrid cultivar]